MHDSGLLNSFVLTSFLAIPAAGILLMLLARKAKTVLVLMAAFSALSAALSLGSAALVWSEGSISAASGILRIDMFSVWHLMILTLAVFTPASFFSISYFDSGKAMDIGKARRFGMLWLGSLASMSLALISGNIGIMWVGIEASTLLSAFLIMREGNPASIEAMWKYIIMCSVGVAFAFIGTLLTAAAAQKAGLGGNESLLLVRIYGVREKLEPTLVLAGFVFILIGYGTKAGLAPMHNWLPDAHSQAPGPVSAMFSGFILNTALYCILRFLPIAAGAGQIGDVSASAAAGISWAASRPLGILMVIGVFSVVLSAIFIFFQKDAKRMLAYCSVEHMGIIAFGYSLGPVGTFAALFHTLNHSLAKTVGFYTAGTLGKRLHSNDFSAFDGAAKIWPLWGLGFVASLLVLIGLAPSGVFMSEFLLIKAAVDMKAYVGLGLVLAAASLVFLVMLRHSIDVAWKKPPVSDAVATSGSTWTEKIVVILPLAILFVLGLWMPETLHTLIARASESLWSVK